MSMEPGEQGLRPKKQGSFFEDPQKLLLSEDSRLRGLAEKEKEDSTSSACVMSA